MVTSSLFWETFQGKVTIFLTQMKIPSEVEEFLLLIGRIHSGNEVNRMDNFVRRICIGTTQFLLILLIFL